MSKYDDAAYIRAARRIWAAPRDDDLEIDGEPEVSQGCDDGAWVSVWVWVRDEEVDPDG